MDHEPCVLWKHPTRGEDGVRARRRVDRRAQEGRRGSVAVCGTSRQSRREEPKPFDFVDRIVQTHDESVSEPEVPRAAELASGNAQGTGLSRGEESGVCHGATVAAGNPRLGTLTESVDDG
jgi:hypothetical protein